MTFKIDDYIRSSDDERLRNGIVKVHDHLLAAYKIADSVKDEVGLKGESSEDLVIVVFNELRKELSNRS